jgi:hypothetical protein
MIECRVGRGVFTEFAFGIKQVKSDFAMYEAIGYPVSYLSVRTQTGIPYHSDCLSETLAPLENQSNYHLREYDRVSCWSWSKTTLPCMKLSAIQ